ncbi:MAG: hypothetical protein Q8891_11775 [Bacteroidota bacterium]|nr:hypothetical protein [Bacteroidota bacterium]
MKFKTFLLITCILTILFYSCKKDKQSGFPSATTTGANTFGLYADKVQFIPCKTTGGISPLRRLQTSSYFSDAIHFDGGITAINDCDKKGYTYGRSVFIKFNRAQIATNKTYKLGSFYDTSKNVISLLYSPDLINYDSDSTLNGTLTVTYYDFSKKILSGNFQATLKNTQGSQAINITDGLFDISF